MNSASAVRVERVGYGGWPNCYRISNGSVDVVVTSDVGPRILRYGFRGGQNLFKEFPEQLGKSEESNFQARGGHRLWKAPEDLATTWIADNQPVAVRVGLAGLTAVSPVESASGLQKEIEISLAQSGNGVRVMHRMRNCSKAEIVFAPWALTVMSAGGVAIAAFPPRAAHPDKLDPTNPLVMWAYTDLSDPRWSFTQKYLVLRQDATRPSPQKIGLFNEHTWAAYLLNGELFIKRSRSAPSETYADFGCSLEMFTNDEFLELETLGPLRAVAPGESVEHIEHWSLHRNVGLNEFLDDSIDRAVLPFVEMERPC